MTVDVARKKLQKLAQRSQYLVRKEGDTVGYKKGKAEIPQKFSKRQVRNSGNWHGRRIQNERRKLERRKNTEEN